MLEPIDIDVRRELSTARLAMLGRSASPSRRASLERAGNALISIGLRLAPEGTVHPAVTVPSGRRESGDPTSGSPLSVQALSR
jgi:hypothetical protein